MCWPSQIVGLVARYRGDTAPGGLSFRAGAWRRARKIEMSVKISRASGFAPWARHGMTHSRLLQRTGKNVGPTVRTGRLPGSASGVLPSVAPSAVLPSPVVAAGAGCAGAPATTGVALPLAAAGVALAAGAGRIGRP